MNKMKPIIIVVAIIVLAIILYFISKPKNESSEDIVIPDNQLSSEEVQVKKDAQNAIGIINNFSDNTTDEYLDSIKPYSSEQFFEDEKELAEVQKQMNEKQGFVSTQKYSITKIELVEREDQDGEILTYKVTGVREYKDSKENDVTYVKYQKIDGQWKIIDVEPES